METTQELGEIENYDFFAEKRLDAGTYRTRDNELRQKWVFDRLKDVDHILRMRKLISEKHEFDTFLIEARQGRNVGPLYDFIFRQFPDRVCEIWTDIIDLPATDNRDARSVVAAKIYIPVTSVLSLKLEDL